MSKHTPNKYEHWDRLVREAKDALYRTGEFCPGDLEAEKPSRILHAWLGHEVNLPRDYPDRPTPLVRTFGEFVVRD